MHIQLSIHNNINIAQVSTDAVIINTTQDAVELIANCNYQGAERIIVHAHQLTPGFFDLKTGIAGDVLQKFSTYQSYLAIVGDFSGYESNSLQAFILESNKTGRIIFVSTLEEALERWSRSK